MGGGGEVFKQQALVPVLSYTDHVVGVRLDCGRPGPGSLVPDDPQLDPLLGVEAALLVGAAHHHILSLGEPVHVVRVVAQVTVFSNLSNRYIKIH